MLVRVSNNQQVNTDHIVNVAQPNANQPDHFTISLSNARQVTTDQAGVDRIEAAMGGTMPECDFSKPDPIAKIAEPKPAPDQESGVTTKPPVGA